MSGKRLFQDFGGWIFCCFYGFGSFLIAPRQLKFGIPTDFFGQTQSLCGSFNLPRRFFG